MLIRALYILRREIEEERKRERGRSSVDMEGNFGTQRHGSCTLYWFNHPPLSLTVHNISYSSSFRIYFQPKKIDRLIISLFACLFISLFRSIKCTPVKAKHTSLLQNTLVHRVHEGYMKSSFPFYFSSSLSLPLNQTINLPEGSFVLKCLHLRENVYFNKFCSNKFR